MDFYRKKYLKYKIKCLQFTKILNGGSGNCHNYEDHNYKLILDVCPTNLCYDNANNEKEKVNYAILKDIKNLKIDKIYMYAIKYSDQHNIYYYVDDNTNKNPDNHKYYDCDDSNKIKISLNHNCLVNNEDIICAGEMCISNKNTEMLLVNNMSGHYQPNDDALSYVACLLDELNITHNLKS